MACQLIRIVQLSEAINFAPIKIVDALNNDITNTCQFSWSTDGVCWTNWTSYLNYYSIVKLLESDFYLKIKIIGSFDKIYLGNEATKCYSISIDNELTFLNDFCGDPNMWQPY